MRVALITNINGKGLQTDAELLASFLCELGHETEYVQFDQPCDLRFDLAISLEIVNEAHFSIAKKHVWIPNLEWAKPEYLCHAKKFDRIWAKTSDAEIVLREKYPHVTYTGFLSRDRAALSIHRERRFLHVGGDSGLKNTNAVIAAWRQWRYWTGESEAGLTVISRSIHTDVVDTEGITFLREVSDAELQQLQNSHLFHLQPSAYEGWGHALRESQSVGAVLLTTQAGPMLEVKAPFEVAPTGSRKINLATAYNVSGRDIREKVGVMLEQPSHMVAKYQVNARARWASDLKQSRERLAGAVEAFTRPVTQVVVPSAPTAHIETSQFIAIMGNFRPEHSTENDLLWTLQDMGYQVTTFQEDTETTDDVLDMCEVLGVSLLIYVHTHGWSTPGTFDLDTLWKRLRTKGVKTCSFHLDRYWGLNALDRREDNIGKHAFWHTDRVFTADGGNQAGFASRGISHTWLPPGVRQQSCFIGEKREELQSDVGFVGATGYHPEYPFREQLISFLRDTYGERFRVFQGYRGQALNDVYQSVDVLVGDSCFGGADYYWSDRIPETCGRGGFLIHPECRGLNIPGMVSSTPGDLSELKDKIDWWLERPVLRRAYSETAMEWVKSQETYSNRMDFLLRSMGVR